MRCVMQKNVYILIVMIFRAAGNYGCTGLDAASDGPPSARAPLCFKWWRKTDQRMSMPAK